MSAATANSPSHVAKPANWQTKNCDNRCKCQFLQKWAKGKVYRYYAKECNFIHTRDQKQSAIDYWMKVLEEEKKAKSIRDNGNVGPKVGSRGDNDNVELFGGSSGDNGNVELIEGSSGDNDNVGPKVGSSGDNGNVEPIEGLSGDNGNVELIEGSSGDNDNVKPIGCSSGDNDNVKPIGCSSVEDNVIVDYPETFAYNPNFGYLLLHSYAHDDDGNLLKFDPSYADNFGFIPVTKLKVERKHKYLHGAYDILTIYPRYAEKCPYGITCQQLYKSVKSWLNSECCFACKYVHTQGEIDEIAQRIKEELKSPDKLDNVSNVGTSTICGFTSCVDEGNTQGVCASAVDKGNAMDKGSFGKGDVVASTNNGNTSCEDEGNTQGVCASAVGNGNAIDKGSFGKGDVGTSTIDGNISDVGGGNTLDICASAVECNMSCVDAVSKEDALDEAGSGASAVDNKNATGVSVCRSPCNSHETCIHLILWLANGKTGKRCGYYHKYSEILSCKKTILDNIAKVETNRDSIAFNNASSNKCAYGSDCYFLKCWIVNGCKGEECKNQHDSADFEKTINDIKKKLSDP